jgi:hypothetical protein
MEVITSPEHLKAVGGGLIGSPDVRLLEGSQIGSAYGGAVMPVMVEDFLEAVVARPLHSTNEVLAANYATPQLQL